MISVSIVTYKSEVDEVKNCLSSFIDNKLVTKICIYENSERPVLSKTQIERINSKVIYFSDPRNLGYGYGHNAAYKLCQSPIQSEYHIILNLDVEVTSETINQLHNYLESSPSTVHCMPKVLNQDGTLQRTCKILPSPKDLILRRFFTKTKLNKLNKRNFEIWGYDYTYILNCPYLSGCFMMLKTQSFERVGMFDTQFFMYPEDIDLTRRLHNLGKTECYPFVSITHKHEQASYKSLRMTWIHIASMIKYFNKWGWFIDKNRDKLNSKMLSNIRK